MTVEGYDVSSWQKTTPSLAGRGFLFARKCYGSRPDVMYATHMANALAHSPSAVRGGYIFGRSSLIVPIASQVAAYLDHNTSELHVLDLERDASGFLALAASEDEGPEPMQAGNDYSALGLAAASTTVSMSLADGRHFIDAMHDHHHEVRLYHGASGFPDIGQDGNWPAKWSDVPPPLSIYKRGDFWQYSSTPIDRDRFAGSMADLYRIAGRTPPPPHVPKVHVAKGATIRVYNLGTKLIDGHLCVKRDWSDIDWPGNASQMAVYAGGPVKRYTCDGGSWAHTVRVKSALAAINGHWIRVGADGVTYS